MANGLLAAIGGGLAGLGQGLVEDGRQKRDEMLKRLDMHWRSEESQKDRDFRAGEGEKDRGFRSGESEKDRTFRSGESEKDRTFRSGESAIDRSFRAGEGEKAHSRALELRRIENDLANAKPSDIARLRKERDDLIKEDPNHPDIPRYNTIIESKGTTATRTDRLTAPQAEEAARKFATRKVETEPGRFVETVDEEKYRQRLTELGYPNLAGTPAASPAPTDAQRKAAEAKATTEAKQKGGKSGPWDDSDFPEDGSRDAFIKRRTDEILSGKASAPDRPAAAPSAEPKSAGAGDGKRRPFFNSPASVQQAVKDGKLKSGDEFVDADGNIRRVP